MGTLKVNKIQSESSALNVRLTYTLAQAKALTFLQDGQELYVENRPAHYKYVAAETTTETVEGAYIALDSLGGRLVAQFDGRASITQWGAVGDWSGVAGTDNSLAIAAAIESGLPLAGETGAFRITQRIDLLTTKKLRLVGPSSCYKDNQESEDGLFQVVCDGAEFFGGYDFANQKLDPAKQRIAELKNVALLGVNGTSTAIVTTMNGGQISQNHFKDFAYHGMIDCGSVQCELGPNSFEDCGLSQSATGAVDSDTFIDGCGMLSVGSVPIVANNNFAATRARNSATFGSSKLIDINVFQTVAATTSFKSAIISNTRSTILIARGYNGVWIGNSTIDMPSPHLEVFASGGVVAADGEPYALAYYNSTVNLTNEFFVTTPANAKGVVLQLRDDPFNAATDFATNSRQKANEQIFTRAHLEAIKFGKYLPSTDSVPYQFAADLGSVQNPLGVWDETTKCMVASQGISFYPTQISQPIIESSVVAGSGGVFDFTSTTICPIDDLNGSGPKGVFEIDVEIVDVNTSEVFYHGLWRGIRQANLNNYQVRFYKVASIDNNPPAGGFTVTENGTGPFTLRVVNNTAFGYRATAKSRRSGVTQTFNF